MTELVGYGNRPIMPAIQAAIAAYDQGIEIEESAKSIGVPARSIYRWLAQHASEEWKAAQQGRALAEYEKARSARDTAALSLQALKDTLRTEQQRKRSGEGNAEENEDIEGVDAHWRLAHAREVLRAADSSLKHHEWLLERLVNRIYGQQIKMEVESTDGDWGARLRRARERTLEGESVDITPQSST